MSLFRCGGGDSDQDVVVLGQVDTNGTSLYTINLSDSIQNYKYIVFSTFNVFSGDFVETSTNPANTHAILTPANFITRGSFTSKIAYGSGSTANLTWTYVDNTTVTVKRSASAVARTHYVYGLFEA